MKIINQSHTIEHITPNILQQIEYYARNCYKSEDKITEDSAEKMVKMLIKKNHTAILEFGSATIRLITSRSVMAELTRHRIASFAIESQRYVNYKEGIEFIRPVWCSDRVLGEHEVNVLSSNLSQEEKDFIRCIGLCEFFYKKLIEQGQRPEQAREVLPNCTKTEIVFKANMRSLRNIFQLRTSKKAHPMIRSLFTNLLIDLKKQIPVVFDDIGGENG